MVHEEIEYGHQTSGRQAQHQIEKKLPSGTVRYRHGQDQPPLQGRSKGQGQSEGGAYRCPQGHGGQGL